MKELYNDAFFEQLSTEQLEGMIDLGMELPASENRKALLRILEVLEERENHIDVEKAWEEFQMYYNIPEGSGIALYETGELPEEKEAESARRKKNPRVVSFPRLRAVGRVAVVAAVTFVLMITTAVAAQAAGYDVFGALGRWTDEIFRFDISDSAGRDNEEIKQLRKVLGSAGLPEDLVPGWHPEGFTLTEIQDASIEESLDSVIYSFSNEKENKYYTVDVNRFYDKELLQNMIIEKNNDADVEEYTKNGRTFYVMLNNFGYTAAWTDGEMLVSMGGNLTKDEIKNIIDSIGG